MEQSARLSREDMDRVALAVLQGSAEAIVYADRDGIIRFWNKGAERLFGFSEAEATGQSLDLIIPDRQRARHWEGYRRVIETGISRYAEGQVLAVPAQRRDGTRISVEFTIVPLSDDTGKLVGMAAIMRDVTERFTELKELRKRLAAPKADAAPP